MPASWFGWMALVMIGEGSNSSSAAGSGVPFVLENQPTVTGATMASNTPAPAQTSTSRDT